MARSVTYNGITRFRPGGISRVRTDASVNLFGTGNTVAIIGEADKGEPGVMISMRDPNDAIDILGPGQAATAVQYAFSASADDSIPGGAAEVVFYKTNNSTQSSNTFPNMFGRAQTITVGAGSTTTVINTTGLVAGALVGKWIVTSTPSQSFRRVAANTTTTITLEGATPVAPTPGSTVYVLGDAFVARSTQYGEDTNGIKISLLHSPVVGAFEMQLRIEQGTDVEVTPRVSGAPTLIVEYVGGTPVVTDTVNTTGLTALNIPLVTGGLTPADHDGHVVEIAGQRVGIATNTANSLVLAAPGLSQETLDAIENGDAVAIYALTDAVGYFAGEYGYANSFVTSITGSTADNVTIPVTSTTTVQQVADALNATGIYAARVEFGKNGSFLARNMDFSKTSVPALTSSVVADIRVSYVGPTVIQGNRGFYSTLNDLISITNSTSSLVRLERARAGEFDGAALDYFPGSPLYETANGLAPVLLTGGSRGVSTNSAFQAGFDALLGRIVDYVVPLIDQDLGNEGLGSTATWDSVAAQLHDHVFQARGAAQKERGAFIGVRGNKTLYLQKAAGFNDQDVQLVSQFPTALDSTGNLVEHGPAIFAAIAAGMRAGVGEIGEPLTNKYIRIQGLRQDPSWEPTSLTDSTDLITAGCLFAEERVGRGFRWVRDLTTWTRDDHLAYAEGSVRDIVRKVVFGLRTDIEEAFTGKKAKPATIGNIKAFAAARLDVFRDQEAIVDSTDPVTGATIHAWYNLRVSSAGDVVKLSVAFFPCPGINFQLEDLYVAIPSQVA